MTDNRRFHFSRPLYRSVLSFNQLRLSGRENNSEIEATEFLCGCVYFRPEADTVELKLHILNVSSCLCGQVCNSRKASSSCVSRIPSPLSPEDISKLGCYMS